MAKSKASKNTKTKKTNKKSRFKVDTQSMLVEGEQLIDEAIIHNGIYWPSCAVLLLALIFTLAVAPQLGIFLAIVAILMFVHATAKKEILFFALTNKRIFVRYGILQVDVVDVQHSKVESIELERMLPGYLMGYANLVIAGTGNRYIVIPYVGNAPEIRRAYNRITLSEDDKNE